MRSPKTGILMLNMGGPKSLSDVPDFLLRLFSDRDIIQLPFQSYLGPLIAKRRTPNIQEKYSEIGGGSPILKWTNIQGELLCKQLDKVSPSSAPHKHYVGFRYVHPLTEEALLAMENDRVEHCIAFSQYPQYSCSTSGSSMNAIHKFYKERCDNTGMKWSIIDRWGTNSHLVKCFAENIRDQIKKFAPEKQKDIFILFSAHSLPLKQVSKGDPYPTEVGATVNLVMKELGFPLPYRLVWQSKVGPVAWLTPSTDSAIKALIERGCKNLILVPISFVNEHIETLHELDIEYIEELGKEVGAEQIERCPCPNDNPLFVNAMVQEVTNVLKGVRTPVQFLTNCPHCTNPSCYQSKKFFRELCKA